MTEFHTMDCGSKNYIPDVLMTAQVLTIESQTLKPILWRLVLQVFHIEFHDCFGTLPFYVLISCTRSECWWQSASFLLLNRSRRLMKKRVKIKCWTSQPPFFFKIQLLSSEDCFVSNQGPPEPCETLVHYLGESFTSQSSHRAILNSLFPSGCNVS